MPEHELPLILVTRHLDADVHVGEALLVPEVVAVDGPSERLHEKLRTLARRVLTGDGPRAVHRRLAGVTPAVQRVSVVLEPPRKTLAWTSPVTLRFDVLRWRHGEEASIGYVPALGIEVVSAREDQLDAMIERHVRVTLARTKAVERLFDLAQLERVESVSVEREALAVDVPTPAQAASDRSKQRVKARPVIESVGRALSDREATAAYEIGDLVGRLGEALTGRQPKSVLLVGPSGVGKTAALGELFRRRHDYRLGDAPFWATSGARLVAGQGGYGMWQERCQTLCREARKAGAILHLGSLVELMEVGKAGGSQFGIANFFRPYLARGDVLAVAECTPEQLPLIERANPHLLAVFQTIRVGEPSPQANKMILLGAALAFAARDGSASSVPVTEDALDAMDRLHRRYATYSASPGRPLRFLKNLLQDREAVAGRNEPLTAADVTAAFSRETGLPLFLLDDAVPLDLGAAHEHFAGRVIGQAEAAGLVTDLLATVKAVLNRPRRPIASLLFVGPTGVGKTEMAKALADYFFGGSGGDRLVRFDMSEFGSPGAVARLAGTAWEAEGLLTRKVREQPFCVILLDEFEKAHPAFFDLLLQVLGEARLTDPSGRVADFSNAIVCMTSNLGAQDFTAGPFGLARGTTDGAAHARSHFTDALREFLRPELFNRIDRVVPFLPLGRETIERIAAREVELIGRRDGVLRRNLRLEVAPEAIAQLARAGYDPVYGARPLKRHIEQDLLAPLAEAVNQYSPATALVARVEVVAGGELRVDVRADKDAAGNRAAGAGGAGAVPFALVQRAAAVRRRVQMLEACPARLALQNELFTLNRLVRRKDAHPGRRFVDPGQRERIKRLQAIEDALVGLGREAVATEDALLLHLYEEAALPWGPAGTGERLEESEGGAGEVLLHLLSLSYPHPHAITIGLFGAASGGLFMLAEAYRGAVLASGGEPSRTGIALPEPAVAVSYYTRLGKSMLQRTMLAAEEVPGFLASPRGGVLGIVLACAGPFARARFEGEGGLHVVQEERERSAQAIWVDASTVGASGGAEYKPPKDVEFRVALAGQRRRTYTLDRREAEDVEYGAVYRWTGRGPAEAIAAAAGESLKRRAEGMLGA